MKTVGAMMWVAGIFIFLGALLAFDTTISTDVAFPGGADRVVNLQLQQMQLIMALGGLALFVAGVITHALGEVTAALAGTPATAGRSSLYTDASALPVSHGVADLAGAGEADEELMERYGITRAAEQYQFGEYKYDRLADAVAYARKQVQ